MRVKQLCAALSCLALAAHALAAGLQPVDIQGLRAGDSVASVLAALNEQGFRVVYSSALVHPDMKLREKPQATRIDELLHEIAAILDEAAQRIERVK